VLSNNAVLIENGTAAGALSASATVVTFSAVVLQEINGPIRDYMQLASLSNDFEATDFACRRGSKGV
jgi:hypothetical protein